MDRPSPQTVVCQIGARRHYAVPVALHRAGLLERFYTDYCMSDPLLRALRRCTPTKLQKGRLLKLFGREVRDIPAGKIHCLWRTTWRNSWSALRTRRQSNDVYERYCLQNAAFGRAVIRQGLGNAEAVYGFNGAAVEIFEYAQAQGVRCVLDQTIAPLRTMADLLEEERSRWPDWDLDPPQRTESISRMIDREIEEWQLSDLILCGSEFVRDSLVAEGLAPSNLRVIRWGSGLDGSTSPSPKLPGHKLNILVAGTVELRKGIPYVLQAAQQLDPQRFEFRAVGAIRLTSTAAAKVGKWVDLRGAVPRTEMLEHYGWADVLLHPSLAEGSANVCYEAASCGLPIVTTPHAGSAVADGIEGFIIPIRDSELIVERLVQLADDLALRTQMSQAAREMSRRFQWERYQQDLSDTMKTLGRPLPVLQSVLHSESVS